MKLFAHLLLSLPLLVTPALAQNPGGAPRVRLAFQDADLGKVIAAIAEISGANIIVAPGVTGRTSVQLTGVSWRVALEMIVGRAGYTVVDEGKILRVVTPEMLDRTVTRKFELLHLKPTERQLAAVKRLLTDRGRLSYDPEHKVVVVNDSWRVAIAVQRKLREIDVDVQAVVAAVTRDCKTLADALAETDPADVVQLRELSEAVASLQRRLAKLEAEARRKAESEATNQPGR